MLAMGDGKEPCAPRKRQLVANRKRRLWPVLRKAAQARSHANMERVVALSRCLAVLHYTLPLLPTNPFPSQGHCKLRRHSRDHITITTRYK